MFRPAVAEKDALHRLAKRRHDGGAHRDHRDREPGFANVYEQAEVAMLDSDSGNDLSQIQIAHGTTTT
jgi:hypothetical protein